MADTTPVGNLDVMHCQFDAGNPCLHYAFADRESLIYALIGRVRVYANGQFLGTIGGRRSVTEPQAHVIRFPAGTPHDVVLCLDGFAADCLIVSCEAPKNTQTQLPYWHYNDTAFHEVGSGTHQRRVGEVVTPPSYLLSVGETYQEAGTTSSWPAHASEQDLAQYAAGQTTWEEKFYCVCQEPAQTVLIGFYPGGKQVQEIRMLMNGEIVQMPLGSHAVTASQRSFFWYFWTYIGSALKKEYRKHSTDVSTYRK